MSSRPLPLPVYTVRLLARKSGLHYSFVSMVLTGVRRPSLEAAAALARAYSISLDEFRRRLNETVKRNQAAKAKAKAKTSNKESLTR